MPNENWYQELLAEEQRQREQLPAIKARLCEALKAHGIARVEIEYDGEGDSGQIRPEPWMGRATTLGLEDAPRVYAA